MDSGSFQGWLPIMVGLFYVNNIACKNFKTLPDSKYLGQCFSNNNNFSLKAFSH